MRLHLLSVSAFAVVATVLAQSEGASARKQRHASSARVSGQVASARPDRDTSGATPTSPEDLASMVDALGLTPSLRARLLRAENQSEIIGPVTVLARDKDKKGRSTGTKRNASSLRAATQVSLYDEDVERDDVRSNGLFDIAAGFDIFPGDVVRSGVLINAGPSAIMLRTDSGATAKVGPGELVRVRGCAPSFGIDCEPGSYSCCGIYKGCIRVTCVVPGGPKPPWECLAGGPGSTACTVGLQE